MLVAGYRVRAQEPVGIGKLQWRDLQKRFNLGRQCRHDGFQINRQQAKGLDTHAAHIVQRGQFACATARITAGKFGQFPRLVLVNKTVHLIGQQHGFAHGLAKFTPGIQRFNIFALAAQGLKQGAAGGTQISRQPPAKSLGQKPGGPAGDIDVFAHQVAVDAADEIVGVELDILNPGIEFGRDVVAQPFRVQPQVQIVLRADAGAPAFAHFVFLDGQKPMHMHMVRQFAACKMQGGRPEQGMEIDNILADEMHLLQIRLGQIGLKISRAAAALDEQVFQCRQITDRRIQPDIEILARRIRYLDTKVRVVPADVPIAQAGFARGIAGKPFFHLVGHLGLQLAVLRPALQKCHTARVAQFEEIMLAGFQHRCGTRQG